MSFPLVLCDRCGSSYAESAWPKLRTDASGKMLQRIRAAIFYSAACVCETNDFGSVETYSLWIPEPDSCDKVIVTHGAQYSLKNTGKRAKERILLNSLAKPVKNTEGQVLLRIGDENISFDLQTGFSVGTAGYLISKKEIEIALRILSC